MTSLEDRLQTLSPERRKLLELALGGASAPVRPRPPQLEEIPLTAAQRRSWEVQEAWPDDTSAVVRLALRMRGPLDEALLVRSLETVIHRHEALRMGFRAGDEHVVQVVRPPEPLRILVEDLGDRPEEEREQAVRRVPPEEAGTPFDLRRDAPLRARIVRLGDDDRLVLVSGHHIVLDGWSTGIFVRELTELYRSRRQGGEPELGTPALQFPDYAVWQDEWLRSWHRVEQTRYWRARLAGAPLSLDLPTRLPRPGSPRFERGYELFGVTAEVSERLRGLAREAGATLYMVLLSAYAGLLAGHAQVPELVVGTPIAGRCDRDLEDSIGLFTNVIAVRVDVSGRPSLRELLGRVRASAEQAYANQDLPIEEVVRELSPSPPEGRAPLFQAMFALHNYPTTPSSFGDLDVEDVRESPSRLLEFYSPTTTRVDLCVSIGERGVELGGFVEHNRAVVDDATAEGLVREWEQLLGWVAENPDRPLEERRT